MWNIPCFCFHNSSINFHVLGPQLLCLVTVSGLRFGFGFGVLSLDLRKTRNGASYCQNVAFSFSHKTPGAQ